MPPAQTNHIPAPARRTQEERRAETRARLLDATLRSLEEVGYPGTTTRRVAELAGVSQGAQTHHFPYRVDLVGAALEELAERRVAELRPEIERMQNDGGGLAALLDLLWADFSGPLFTVVVKLWVAAADDPELYARLVPIERSMARAIIGSAIDFGGDELLGIDEWEVRISLALSAIRGLALSQAFEPRERRAGRDPWPPVRDLLVRALGTP